MPAKMLNELVSRYVAPLLKLAHFNKYRFVWNRRVGQLVHVIHIEASRWNDENESAFGLSVGVSVDDVRWIVWDEEPPRVVREVDCLPRFPYGYLPGVDIGRNIGWELHNTEDIERVGPEVVQAIQLNCLPVLDECRSVEAVLALAGGEDRWKQPAEKLALAVLMCLVGQKASGEALLDAMETNPRLAGWQPRIQGTRSRLKKHLLG